MTVATTIVTMITVMDITIRVTTHIATIRIATTTISISDTVTPIIPTCMNAIITPVTKET